MRRVAIVVIMLTTLFPASGSAAETPDQIVAKALDGAATVIRQGADDTRVQAAVVDIKANLATALKLYQLDNGTFPTTEEGLQALLTSPPGAKQWHGPYVGAPPRDPWGREYRYVCPGRHGAYDLFSVGLDGQEGTADDVTNYGRS